MAEPRPPGVGGLRSTARRALDWLSVSGVGVLLFVSLALAVERRMPPGGLGTALLLILLVVSTRVYLVRAQPYVERLIGRRRRSFDTELALFADRAAALQTTPELGRAVDRFLGALSRRLAALVVVDQEQVPRLAYSAWGSVPAPPRQGVLLDQLVRARGWVSVHEGGGPQRDEIQRACVRWGAEYLAPMVEGDELLGIVAVAPSRTGGIADALELDTLERMRVTLTAAVAGVRLYDRLRDLSSELEGKAAARQEALAEALRRLHGAETRLVQGEKLASLGHIVAGVAEDLTAQVQAIHALVGPLAEQAGAISAAADGVARAQPEVVDARLDEMSRDVGPLVGAIREGARRAYSIAQDLSGFAPAHNARPPEPSAFAVLHPVLDSTLALVGSDLQRFEVVRLYDSAVARVAIEEGPLGQVMLNLMLNAVQAMGQGGTLTLTTRAVEGVAEVAVADTGPGIPADVMPHIFEPFFSTKGPTKGTGLGLSVSYRIVERHGGRILVDSEPGAGCTFRVRLPLAEPASADEPPAGVRQG